jgi:hypothetical protein
MSTRIVGAMVMVAGCMVFALTFLGVAIWTSGSNPKALNLTEQYFQSAGWLPLALAGVLLFAGFVTLASTSKKGE